MTETLFEFLLNDMIDDLKGMLRKNFDAHLNGNLKRRKQDLTDILYDELNKEVIAEEDKLYRIVSNIIPEKSV